MHAAGQCVRRVEARLLPIVSMVFFGVALSICCLKYLWRAYSVLIFAARVLSMSSRESTSYDCAFTEYWISYRTRRARLIFIQTPATSLSAGPVSLRLASTVRCKSRRRRVRSRSGPRESFCLKCKDSRVESSGTFVPVWRRKSTLEDVIINFYVAKWISRCAFSLWCLKLSEKEISSYSLTHLILGDELDDEAHVVERTLVRIVGDHSRRLRRELGGHRRHESVAFPKVRDSSAVDDRHLQIHLPFKTLVLVHRLKWTSQTIQRQYQLPVVVLVLLAFRQAQRQFDLALLVLFLKGYFASCNTSLSSTVK